jgi:activator of HSP90 ATPase
MLKVVQQSVELPAPPADLFAMYLDASEHAALTGGGPATIAPAAGSEWSAFGGRIWGRVLALTPSQQIVQSWRSFEWEEAELDAVLVLSFTAAGEGARVDLVQVGVPDRLYDTLVTGWPVRYWQPWRAYLDSRSSR